MKNTMAKEISVVGVDGGFGIQIILTERIRKALINRGFLLARNRGDWVAENNAIQEMVREVLKIT